MNNCSILKSFPFTLRRWAQGEGIRVSNLDLISRGTTPRTKHHLSSISIASWDMPSHYCVQEYPQLSLLSPLFFASGLFSHPDTGTSLTSQLRNITALPELHSYFSCLSVSLLSDQLPCVGREAELSLQILCNSASSSADTHLHSR